MTTPATGSAQQRKAAPTALPPLTRYLALADAGAAPALDTETRTLSLSWSSEYPVDRWFGSEILSHAPGAADLSRLNDGAPLLFNHNIDDVIGVVSAARIDSAARKGYATVRFAATPRGDEVMALVADDVLRGVSFMYRVADYQDMGNDTYIGTQWTPMELSIVSIPADPTVGVGRAPDTGELPVRVHAAPSPAAPAPAPAGRSNPTPGVTPMSDTTTQTAGAGTPANVVDINAARAESAAQERARIAEIEGLCAAHNIPADTRAALIRDGLSVAEARGIVLNTILSRGQDTAALSANGYAPDLSAAEKSRYSIIRAVNAAVSGSWKDAGFEAEVSNAIAKRMGKSTSGFFLPTNIAFGARAADYAAGVSTTGGALVATQLLSGSFIDALRNSSRVLSLGATVLSGLVGNVDIPRQTGITTTYWVGEQTNLTNSGAPFDKVSLALKTVGALSQVTRQMLMQGTPDIEMLVRADIIRSIALAIDLAALSGTGTTNQPRGIANVAGIGSVVGGANGAAITIDHLIDLETACTNANAPENGLAYLANARTVGALKKLKSTTGEYLWVNTPDAGRTGTPGEINGYTVARSNQARNNLTKGTSVGVASEVFFGAWPELMVGEWGVLEIQPNPYAASVSAQGGVELRALQSVDIGVRHAASFAVMSDALTA